MNPIQAVFFDVDGVLLDSLAPHLKICEDLSREYGLNLKIPNPAGFKELARTRVRISPMKFMFMAVGFPEREAEKADERYQRTFLEDYPPSPFPGVPEMLSRLCAAGLPLGIVTANVKRNVETVLGPSLDFIDPRFRFTIDHPEGSSKAHGLEAGARELHISTRQMVYVGDQLGDLKAAEEAAAQFLGVTYGWGISANDVSPSVDSPAAIADFILSKSH